MYAWYQQIHAPTGIENCVYCNFTSDKEKDLIVTAASQLTIYRLRKNVEVHTKPEKSDDTVLIKDKLEQIGTWQLYENVIGIKNISLSGSTRDSLLLSFKEAKLSMLEFDNTTHDIKTSSLHFFEDNLYKDGLIQRVSLPNVSVDPDGRCASLQLSTNSVAIIPFRTRDVSLAADEDASTSDGIFLTNKRGSVATSYSIDLHEVDSRLQRIIDIQFLHSYYEPTLLILFESLRTWAGRVALRQDTCNIVAISLNMTERLHPVIWSLNGLPFDCKYACAVPKPIGGVLIFAVNSVIYLNQSVPPYGISLNSLTHNSTSFPLKPQDGICMTLDCSKATFISPESLVISLKNGELYVLTLLVDSMRSVRNFHFDKAASSVLTSCITNMDDGFIFLGSRLGNSLLLHYTEARSDGGSATLLEGEEPASKRKRLNTAAEWAATDGNDPDDVDMYGRDTVTSEPLSSYNFEVCDSLLNIGPCGAAELGEPAFLSEEFVSQRESDLELAVLSGHGKNGALSVIQRTVKPQVVTTFELPGCIDMWTVQANNSVKKVQSKEFAKQHGYLILSRNDSTLILETGKEIMEVEESGYNTRQPTIYVGNIGGERNLILQVCAEGVWLVDGVELIQQIPLDLGSPIVQCSLINPYAMLLTADGQFVMLTLKDAENEQGFKLYCSNPSLAQAPQVRCVCLYSDSSGMFVNGDNSSPKRKNSTEDIVREDSKLNDKWNLLKGRKSSISGDFITADEEDELLYGESDPNINQLPSLDSSSKHLSADESVQPEDTVTTSDPEETIWAVVARENGTLEIYSLPQLNLSYVIKNFTIGQKLLVDSSIFHSVSGETDKPMDSRYSDNPQVFELLLVGLGYKRNRPHLLARVEEELLVYEAFPFKPNDKGFRKNSLRIRFKKVNHSVLMRRQPGTYDPNLERQFMDRQTRLRPFDNVGGYSGVFLCGPYPHWLFMTARGALRCHPMNVDGLVTCFVSFHNVNCPNGFLYFNRVGELRICMLPPHMKYDNLWPVRKVALRSTVHFITYSIEHKVYALVSSVSEPCTRLPYLNCENEREFEDLEKDDRFVYPHIDKFSVQLISPISWELIPNARIDMDEFEHVTCMKNVWLSPGTDNTVRQNYVVLGTCNVMGEEMSSRGKIIILEVIEVVPEPGQPLTKNKLKQLYSEEQKGPVTALCGVEGNLLAAIGQKVFIWRFDENQSLRGVAFVDTNVYIHHAFSFRSFAIIADIQRSITLLRYQEEFKTLSVTSRDVRSMDVYTADLLVDGSSVGFVASDQDKNLIVFVYDPEAKESFGGSRLIRRADIHIGSHVNCMWRIGTCLVDRASGVANEPYAGAHVTMMGTLDGALCNLLPVTEKIYRRLLMLQNAMSTGLLHTAGLNPKAFRLVRSQSRGLNNPVKNVLDGDLLWRFKDLSYLERVELAKKIGTTSDQVLDDLMDIQRATVVM